MTDQHEVEAKFEADPDSLATLLDLQEVDGLTVAHNPAIDQDDLYFDTEAGHLKAAGASLRVRRKDDLALMTFKGERMASEHEPHIVTRLEDEVELPGFDVGTLTWERPLWVEPEPSPLSRGRRLTAGADLLPVARLQTNRTVLMVMDDVGQSVELAVDLCVATRVADRRIVDFVEVEAELKAGDAEFLTRVLQGLQAAVPGLQPSTRTKLERALA